MKRNLQLFTFLILSLTLVIASSQSSISPVENSLNQSSIKISSPESDKFIYSSVNETIAYPQSVNPQVYWGWIDNLSFIYWDVTQDEGISGANVSCYLGGLSPDFYDLGNGTYLVEVNTALLLAQHIRYSLMVAFDKSGFENQVTWTDILVLPVPTHVEVLVPEENKISGNPYELMIPLGDSIDLLFQYNDTMNNIGLKGASTTVTIIGPTLVQHQLTLSEIGDGVYNMTFDTTDGWLYASVGGIPYSHYQPYLLDIQFSLENRSDFSFELSISIIDIPTELRMEPFSEQLAIYPGTNSIFLYLVDLWPSHDEVLIQGANITVDLHNITFVEVVSITEDPTNPGVYEIVLGHTVPASVQATMPSGGCIPETHVYASISLSISIKKEGYMTQEITVITDLIAYGRGGWGPTPPLGLLLPIAILVYIGVQHFRNKRRLQPSAAPIGIE